MPSHASRGSRPRSSPVPSLLGLAAWLAVALSLATASLPRDVARDTLTRRGEQQYAWARSHLNEPFVGYELGDDLGVREFDILLLSNLASGFMNVATLEPARTGEAAELVGRVVERALSPLAQPSAFTLPDVAGQNLYASHLLLILAIEQRLAARAERPVPDTHRALAEALATHLHTLSLADPSAHARSYPRSARWPADQSVTLAALATHDRAAGTDLARQPIFAWLRWLDGHLVDGLPWSSVDALPYQQIPRGCALSFLSIYVARFAPARGAAIYQRHRDAHGIDWLGWRGFREWPPGHDGGSDVDAGPVLFGWGTAATGIGLGAARLYDDREMAAGIERIADTVGGSVPFSGRYLLAPTLGQAMLFSGSTATPWDDPAPTRGAQHTGWPIAPLLGLIAWTAPLAIWVRRARVRAADRT